MRSTIPDILMFMRRVGPHHPDQMGAIARHTKQSYNIICAYEEDTTAYQCLNRAIDRSTSRWMCVIDDDAIPLQDYWLRDMIDVLERHDDVGMIGASEVKSEADLEDLMNNPLHFGKESDLVVAVRWVPGYFTIFDREKVPHVRCDEGFAGRYGMSDLDLCLQVREAGLDVAYSFKTTMYHPWKNPNSAFRDKYQMEQPEAELPLHEKHREYMFKKWGQFYLESSTPGALRIIEGKVKQI